MVHLDNMDLSVLEYVLTDYLTYVMDDRGIDWAGIDYLHELCGKIELLKKEIPFR